MAFLLFLTELLHYAACFALLGALSFRFYAPAALPGELARPRGLIRAASLVALLTACVWLVLEAGTMGDGWQDAFNTGTIGRVLADTSFGALWSWRLGVAAVANMLAWSRGVRRGGGAEPASDPVLLALALGLAASLAGSGHAADGTGALGVARMSGQAVHLAAAGLWLGGLPPLALALRRERDAGILVALLRRFSATGMVAVAAILVTGIADTALIGGLSVRAMLATGWGQALAWKLGLVAALLAVATWNRQVLLPRADLAGFKRTVAAELVLALLVLAAAARLGAQAPPGM